MPKIDENSTIGQRIRRKRLELKLEQKEVAAIIGTCEDTITGWENARCEPQIQYAPKIIAFLGYNPYSLESDTFGGRVKSYRTLSGIGIERFAAQLNVDVTTVRDWESNKRLPKRPRMEQLNALLKPEYDTAKDTQVKRT